MLAESARGRALRFDRTHVAKGAPGSDRQGRRGGRDYSTSARTPCPTAAPGTWSRPGRATNSSASPPEAISVPARLVARSATAEPWNWTPRSRFAGQVPGRDDLRHHPPVSGSPTGSRRHWISASRMSRRKPGSGSGVGCELAPSSAPATAAIGRSGGAGQRREVAVDVRRPVADLTPHDRKNASSSSGSPGRGSGCRSNACWSGASGCAVVTMWQMIARRSHSPARSAATRASTSRRGSRAAGRHLDRHPSTASPSAPPAPPRACSPRQSSGAWNWPPGEPPRPAVRAARGVDRARVGVRVVERHPAGRHIHAAGRSRDRGRPGGPAATSFAGGFQTALS